MIKNTGNKLTKKRIKQIIQKELLIWTCAYPRSKVLGKFANKIVFEINLLK